MPRGIPGSGKSGGRKPSRTISIKRTRRPATKAAQPKRTYTRRTTAARSPSRVSNEQILAALGTIGEQMSELLGIARQQSPGYVAPLARTGTGGD